MIGIARAFPFGATVQLTTEKLTVPAAEPSKADLEFDMVDVFKLESREREIGTMDKVQAPELMQAFINGFGHVSRHLAKLELELKRAENAMEVRKASVYLDEAPRILREKGVVRESNPGGSEDQRKAVLAQDKSHQDLKDRHDQIEAATRYMELKLKFFEMAYQAVKKVYDSLSGLNAAAIRSSSYSTTGGPPIPARTSGGHVLGTPRY
jgi:hypothetical protein